VFTRFWKTSDRRYGVVVERDARVAVRDGTLLVGDIFRPNTAGRFPVILGCHPYNNELQTAPIKPIGHANLRGFIEAGDPSFYVRRGYVHAIFNVRGTGKSQGYYQLMGPLEAQDVPELIEWLATGRVASRQDRAVKGSVSLRSGSGVLLEFHGLHDVGLHQAPNPVDVGHKLRSPLYRKVPRTRDIDRDISFDYRGLC